MGDVALVEAKVWLVVEDGGVVEGGAVVELVERDNVVGIGICESEVADKPACSVVS